MLLWVNLHGGFVVGFLFMGIFLSGNFLGYLASTGGERSVSASKLKRLSLVFSASVLAAFVNPFGVHSFFFPFRLLSETYLMDHVQEFMSPNFHDVVPYRYLLLFLIGILGLSKAGLTATELMLVLPFTSMSLYSARYIPLCAIVYAPILSKYGDVLIRQSDAKFSRSLRERSLGYERIDASAKGFVLPMLVLAIIAALATGRISIRFPEKTTPTAAIEFLRTNPIPGNMFNNDEIGDHVIYNLYPRYKVFVDGRLDMYGTRIVKEYEEVISLQPGWRDVLVKYDINFVFYYTDSILPRILSSDAGWRRIYTDNVASIFLRNTRENAEAIARYNLADGNPGSGR